MKLTKEQFIAQFPIKISFDKCYVKPVYSRTYKGVEVYRALNLLVIKIDGEFYASK